MANICLIIEKAREFQKNNYFFFFDYAKAFGNTLLGGWKVIVSFIHIPPWQGVDAELGT